MNSSYTIIFTIVIVLLILDSTKAGPVLASACCGIQCGVIGGIMYGFFYTVAAPCMGTCAAIAATCQGPCGAVHCLAPTP